MEKVKDVKISNKDNKSIIIGIIIILLITIGIIVFNFYNGNRDFDDDNLVNSNVFNNNMSSFKEALGNYLKNNHYPKEEATITLSKLYEEKLLLTLKDENNASCDQYNSYGVITRNKDNYKVLIKLVCPTKEDEIVYYLDLDNSDNNSDNSSQEETYVYQYKLVTAGYYTSWSNWTAWSKNSATSSQLVEVETKEEKVPKETTNEVKKVEYIDMAITCPKDYHLLKGECVKKNIVITSPKCNEGYLLVGSKCLKKPNAKVTSNSVKVNNLKKKTNNSDVTINNLPSSTNENNVGITPTCNTGYDYLNGKCQKEELIYGDKTYVCPDGYQINSKQECYKIITTTVAIKDYDLVKYYRYRTRKYISSTSSIKWSSSQEDRYLISLGYYFTGQKKEL